VPCSGRDEFISEYGLEKYTVSENVLRIMVASTNIDIDGTIEVSRRDDRWVSEKIRDILERRFYHGLFTVYKPTNPSPTEITQLKQIAYKYNYKVYCVDFSKVSFNSIKERNENKNIEDRIDIKVLSKMYDRLAYSPLPQGMEIVKPENGEDIFYKIEDYSRWKKINFIGDIHGCYDALKKLIEPIADDELYIFCGDYLDRGIQNVQTIEYLMELSERKNMIFLSGNHERHLKNWANKETIVSQQFQNFTKKELESASISSKKVKRFCDALKECFYGEYHGKRILACHGGVSNIPTRIDFIASDQLISGVGKYKDGIQVEKSFCRNVENTILVHGHRNVMNESIHPAPNCYNLENGVEIGGTIRMVSISENDIETKEIVNTNFGHKSETLPKEEMLNLSKMMKNHFTDGILINEDEAKIIVRTYKRDEIEVKTHEEIGKGNMKTPSTIYRVLHGDICGFSSHDGKPVFLGPEGFEDALRKNVTNETVDQLNIYCNQNNASLSFIWDKAFDDIVLIDIFINHISLNRMYYDKLFEVARTFHLPIKKKIGAVYTAKDIKKIMKILKRNESYMIESQKGTVTRVVS
jgi:predicted kinase